MVIIGIRDAINIPLNKSTSLSIKCNTMFSCKSEGMRTNVDRSTSKETYKFMLAVVMEVLLPPKEKCFPLSQKNAEMVAEMFRSGVIDRNIFRETMIRSRNVALEGKLKRVYDQAAKKLCYQQFEYIYPPCKDGEKYTFSKRHLVSKCKKERVCCVHESCPTPLRAPCLPNKEIYHMEDTFNFIDNLYSNQCSLTHREPYDIPQVCLEPPVVNFKEEDNEEVKYIA